MQTKDDSWGQIAFCWHSACPSALLISVQLFALQDMEPDKKSIEGKDIYLLE